MNIVEQAAVMSVEELDGGVRIAIASDTSPDRQHFTGNQCVLTAGPWTAQLLELLGIHSGILPIRGQVLVFHPPRKLLTRIINEGHRYLVPRDDGRLLVGSNEKKSALCVRPRRTSWKS